MSSHFGSGYWAKLKYARWPITKNQMKLVHLILVLTLCFKFRLAYTLILNWTYVFLWMLTVKPKFQNKTIYDLGVYWNDPLSLWLMLMTSPSDCLRKRCKVIERSRNDLWCEVSKITRYFTNFLPYDERGKMRSCGEKNKLPNRISNWDHYHH